MAQQRGFDSRRIDQKSVRTTCPICGSVDAVKTVERWAREVPTNDPLSDGGGYFGDHPWEYGDGMRTVIEEAVRPEVACPRCEALENLPGILFQSTLVTLGDRTPDGHIVEAVTIPWSMIVMEIQRNPAFLYEVPWRRLEELIAGAYSKAGWANVTLTPRSGDKGRDVIAEKPGSCAIRIIDQIKAYAPNRCVTAEDLRAMLGVLSADPNVSKGFVTTTAGFAPRIYEDANLTQFMPYRLELKDGECLRKWLLEVWRTTADRV